MSVQGFDSNKNLHHDCYKIYVDTWRKQHTVYPFHGLIMAKRNSGQIFTSRWGKHQTEIPQKYQKSINTMTEWG